MLDTDLFESQTTFTKNLIKTFRPKTFGHPRFEFVKKATASFNGSYQSRPQSSSLPRSREELWGTLKQSVFSLVYEEQSKAPLIGAFMLARGVSSRRKAQISNFWL